MGQKDHVESAAGHILHLGLDLEYLHVARADRHTGGSDEPPAMEEQGETSGSSDKAASPLPDAVEENIRSDADSELALSSTIILHEEGHEGSTPGKNTHQPLCRTQCVDLGTEGPPELSPELKHDNPLPPVTPCKEPPEPPEPPPPEPVGNDGRKGYQAKLDFALKLGYSEETVRQVLSKLGPETLINDILGELVKLGNKPDSEQPARTLASSSSSSSSSSSCGSSDVLDGQRSNSPCPSDSLGDQDNLRPIVVDGSNVAMRYGNGTFYDNKCICNFMLTLGFLGLCIPNK